MNLRRWHDNWWMGWIFAIIVADVLGVFGVDTDPAPSALVVDAIFLAIIVTISYRGRRPKLARGKP